MKKDTLFNTRLQPCLEELQSLFFSLYGENREAFSYFLGMLERSLTQRKPALRRLDQKRLSNPEWCRSSRMLGMMLYPSCFAGTLRGVQEKLPYLKECGVNYLHLMPLLDSPEGKSDGGYAVSDFRKVRPPWGTEKGPGKARAYLCYFSRSPRKKACSRARHSSSRQPRYTRGRWL